MARAMKVVGEALALFDSGLCRQPQKAVLRGGEDAASEDNGRFNALFASLGVPARVAGMKWIASFPDNRSLGLPRASALLVLNSAQNGLPLAVMDGTLVSAVRTGAVTAIAAQFLAPRGARKVGVIGAGVQARTQVLGLVTALPGLEEIAIANRSQEGAEVLAAECYERWGIRARAVSSPAGALAEADIALTVTTAHEPVMRARDIKPGALSIQLAGNECEFDVLRQCDKIVTDNWDVIKHRGIMTPALMHAQGLLQDEHIYGSVGELVLGRKPGREHDHERIHLAHMGMGVCDVALAWCIYQAACCSGVGQRLRLWKRPFWA